VTLSCDLPTIQPVSQECEYGPSCRSRSREPRTERIWKRPGHRLGSATERRRAAQDSCLLACLQLLVSGGDLPAGESAASRGFETGAHQEPAAGPLGHQSRPIVYLCPPQPVDQKI